MSVLSCKSIKSQRLIYYISSRNFSSSWNEVKSLLPYSMLMQCMLRGTPHKYFITYFMEFSGSWIEVKSALPPSMQCMLQGILHEYFTSIWNEVKSVLPPACSVCYTGHSTWRVILLDISRNFSSSWNEVKTGIPLYAVYVSGHPAQVFY
jgi:hypothetical protein